MDRETTPERVTPGWADHISAITLFTEDLGATRRFYLDVLSLALVHEDDVSAVFRLGATLINLLDSTRADELVTPAAVAGPEAGARAVFTITVHDVDARCEALRQTGVRLINGPMDRPWGIRTASFADPAGHIWEIAR